MINHDAAMLFLISSAAGMASVPAGFRLAFQIGCAGLGMFVWIFGA